MTFENRNTSKSPEIEFVARVHMDELRLEVVPTPVVCFSGHPERKSDWQSERENLPQRVKNGVVYRNAEVKLLIASETDFDALNRSEMG